MQQNINSKITPTSTITTTTKTIARTATTATKITTTDATAATKTTTTTTTTTGTNTNLNSTNIQIGTSSASALSVNSTSTFNSDINLSNTKNLKLKLILPYVLDDIYFGGTSNTYSANNVYFNMTTIHNQPVSVFNNLTIGQAGASVNLQTYNSVCDINSSGNINLTGSNLNLVGNIYLNNINSTSTLPIGASTSISLNSQTINIGANQGPLALNVVNIGSNLAASTINLNGAVYSVFPIQTTSIFQQF